MEGDFLDFKFEIFIWQELKNTFGESFKLFSFFKFEILIWREFCGGKADLGKT